MAERSDTQAQSPLGRRALLEKRLQALAERLPEGQPGGRPQAVEAYVLPQDGPPGVPPIPRRAPDATARLSFAQQRLWFLDRLQPDSPLYNTAAAVELRGRLDVAALAHSLNEIVARHEVLRTTFALEDGEPVQVVHPQLALELPVLDLGDHRQGERDAAALRRATEHARRTFDLARGPLIRTELLKLGAERHILLINMHHIISDGWSAQVVLRELVALYESFVAGRPATLPELPIQYADFARWQRTWLAETVLEAQLIYWKWQLAGPLPLLQLPLDRPRPPVQTGQGARLLFRLPPELAREVKGLSQREGVTLFMTLLTAFKALLARYSGQTDILVGTPVANRTRAELEPLIGFFVNMLVLRTSVAGQPSFRELLARVRETTLGAFDHQELPFEKLVEELRPERDLSRAPLCQVAFSTRTFGLQESLLPQSSLAGLSFHPLELDTGTAKFDLSLTLGDGDEGLVGELEYNSDLFDATTIARLAGHFETLLAACVAQPDRPIPQLPLLTPAELAQLQRWNATGHDFGPDVCLHALFEAQAARTPEAVAVVFEEQQLTYAELDARANQLAHVLRGRGVGPDTLVGVCMERSPELVVALYGILKAGGAYVPLDAEYPAERLAFMLDDAQVRVLLIQQRLRSRLPALAMDVLALDGSWEALAHAPATPCPAAALPANLAYMIYTSGSTGRPKGALNTHRAIVNRLRWMQAAYELDARDVVLQKTPFSFDVSVWEFFWPLLAGARLVLARPGGQRDGGYLARLIAQAGVTTLHFVPSMLQVFLDEPALAACDSLRRVICSGEALSPELQQRCLARLPGVELHNLYGPTEAAVDVTAWACAPSPEPRSVPIGHPIANITIRLLDRDLQLVPVGVAGELHIGGVGLARGYHRRPALTAERFIPDPFCGQTGARLYKTGDLARYLPDSSVEYLGRLDHQVKLRGFRVELGEIESVLAQQPGVREAVVLAREDQPGDTRLVAYVVPEAEAQLRLDELRDALRQRLPDYMLPAALVPLDALPLTPNGKLDRRALPAPEATRAELKTAFVAPETPLERELAAIWCELLRVERVGLYDNFFDLGGHSLLATQVLSRIHAAFQIDIPLQLLFTTFTIAELASYIARHQLQPAHDDTLAELLGELEQLSDAEVEALLARDGAPQ